MEKKKKIYIGIIILIFFGAGLVFYSSFITPNYSYLAKYDNVKVSSIYMSKLYQIANNKSLANKIGPFLGTDLGYQRLNNSAPLYDSGKPDLFYFGAEFCPYCAITRWSIIIALMRFGNFTGLEYMTSSGSDVFKYTPTFTFYNSTYKSKYISFSSIEATTNVESSSGSYPTLQTANQIENNTLAKFDPNGNIPFLDFGNVSIQQGVIASPQIIRGDNWTTILTDLNNPNSPVSQQIIQGANLFTARICEMTNNQPANVCSQQYVKSVEKYN